MEPKSKGRNLGESFSQTFELLPALDDHTLEQVYRIRHDVYCRDLSWEPMREDGLETDEYDRHSLHILLRTRAGEPVGCTRLILARPQTPDHPLPFEQSCRGVLDRSIADPATLPRHTIGEVSRLAVLNTFRQRRGEDASAISMTEEDLGGPGPQARFPFVPVSLYLGAAAIARRFGVEHVFVLTEPRLASHFSRIGFDIRAVGGAIEHRGTRVPSLLSSSKVVAGLRPTIRPMYELIEHAVQEAFRAYPYAARRKAWTPSSNSQTSASAA